MFSRAATTVAPLYLFACILLGATDQPSWQDAVLEVTGVLIIILAAAVRSPRVLGAPARQLLFLAIAGIAIIALEGVRLPAPVWHGSGRPELAATYYRAVLQLGPWYLVWLPPPAPVGTLLATIPPLATFCAFVRLGTIRPGWLIASMLAAAFAWIAASLVLAGMGPGSGWHPSSHGKAAAAVGLMNSDHLGNLIVITLPFIAAIARSFETQDTERNSGMLLISAALFLLMISGLVLTGSVAAYVLSAPVIAASALIVLPWENPFRRPMAAIAVLFSLGAVAALPSIGHFQGSIGHGASTSVQSLHPSAKTMAREVADHMPLGSGVGSFARVYASNEKSNTVATAVTHAGDDYAEAALELGLPGIALILSFLAWWAVALRSVWGNRALGAFARAASIATGAILVDSLVDFPLRTAAISACLAACCALLADRRVRRRPEAADLRPARHLVVR